MELSIIIVNYNVKEFLQNLVHSLQKAVSKLNYEIIVVDNASDDGSVEFIREKFPKINLIVSQTNLGFSKANNAALKAAKGKFILFINPHTIVSEDTITNMIKFLNENGQMECVSLINLTTMLMKKKCCQFFVESRSTTIQLRQILKSAISKGIYY